MSLTLAMITIDTTDAEALAAWWAAQTGADIAETNDGWFVVLTGGGLPARLGFQQVEEVTPGKNRQHLDLAAEDLEAETERLVSAGASLVERRGFDGFVWHTFTDPQGNEFCVSGPEHA